MERDESSPSSSLSGMPRRDFLRVLGAAGAAGAGLGGRSSPEKAAAAPAEPREGRPRGIPFLRGAFLYPSTASLKRAGYFSWPGSGFDAEGHQRDYARKIDEIARGLSVRVAMDAKPLLEPESVARFIAEVKAQRPDGLLLIPFKKSEWPSVVRIVDETNIPAIVYAALGVLLNPHINQLHRRPGAYLISSVDNFEAIASGLRMIRAAHRMRTARILSIAGGGGDDVVVEGLGTRIRRIPRDRFTEVYRRTEASPAVRTLAREYAGRARRIVEPGEADILEAAKTYAVSKELLAAEEADAIMMDCLGGIRDRHFPPPCMGFLSLRDEGIPAGCQNDLSATLSLMLMQYLFDRPGFQQNAVSETEANHYYGAHCTSPTRLHGADRPPAPYILRNHAEAGVGVAPQVLWEPGEPITMAQYLPGEEPQMYVYSGEVVACQDTPPAGGCRTNIEATIREVEDVCDVKGMHQAIICGDFARPLRRFCQLLGIPVVT